MRVPTQPPLLRLVLCAPPQSPELVLVSCAHCSFRRRFGTSVVCFDAVSVAAQHRAGAVMGALRICSIQSFGVICCYSSWVHEIAVAGVTGRCAAAKSNIVVLFCTPSFSKTMTTRRDNRAALIF